MITPLRSLSLAARALVALAGVLFAATVLLTGVQYWLTTRILSANWNAQATRVARVLEFTVMPLLAGQDYSALRHAVLQTALLPEIRSLTVADANGVIVADSSGQRLGQLLQLHSDPLPQALAETTQTITWVKTEGSGRVQYTLVPLREGLSLPPHQGPLKGAILVATDLQILDGLLKANFRSLVVINTVVFIVLLVAFWAALRAVLGRPLTGLAQTARSVRESLPDPRPPLTSSEEVGMLTETFTQATEALRKKERELREALEGAELARGQLDALFAAAPAGLIYVTPELVVERINEQAARVHGRTVQEHRGKPLPELLPPERWAVLKPIYERILTTREPYHGVEEELPDRLHPGRVLHLSSDYYPDRAVDGSVRGVLVVVHDRSAQKQAQQDHEQYRKEREAYLKEIAAKDRALEELAIRDPLTGLYNQNYFEEALAQQWRRFQRTGEPFTVIVMDVDGLSNINEQYGREVGDRALRQIGTALQAGLRETDLVARVGGDEFAVLLAQTDKDHREAVLEKVRASLKDLRMPTPMGPISIALGFGSASVPGFPPVASADELFRLAKTRQRGAKRLASPGEADAG